MNKTEMKRHVRDSASNYIRKHGCQSFRDVSFVDNGVWLSLDITQGNQILYAQGDYAQNLSKEIDEAADRFGVPKKVAALYLAESYGL